VVIVQNQVPEVLVLLFDPADAEIGQGKSFKVASACRVVRRRVQSLWLDAFLRLIYMLDAANNKSRFGRGGLLSRADTAET
jgi:hypothetical protein